MKEVLAEKLAQLFNQADYGHCFLLDIDTTPAGHINIKIDSDTGVTLDLCTTISRYLESYLDEAMPEGKYTLEVSSAGVSRPLSLPRQYKKNIGRLVKVKTLDGRKSEGKLVAADDQKFTVEIDEVTLEGKRKKKDKKNIDFLYDEISETKIQVSFT